ncbi:MAG: metal ABC transporter substrate-binding protein [Actinomycetota bacterium]|nr:metal ABC transporter substrate-binding protein [Actinomycetota bacterium]
MLRLIGVVALIISVAACGSDSSEDGADADGRVEVVASFYPVAEAAQRVGGDLVRVVNLTRPGTEPHDIELSPPQVDRLQDADLVLYLGQGFQPAVEEIAERRRTGAVDLLEVVELEEGAAGFDAHGDRGDAEEDHGDEAAGEAHAEEGALDPHFWLDPTRMARAVDGVEQALAKVAPEHGDAFSANAQRYKQALAALDEEFAATLKGCQRRLLVTSHAAFHYLAARYDLEHRPIAGLSPETEPNPARLAELADLIRREGVITVFYETLVAPDVAETLAGDAGVKTSVLNPLEGLTQEEIDQGKDYAAVMRENLAALAGPLGCR